MKKKGNETQNKSYHFKFINFNEDTDLLNKTNIRLAQFLAIAPPGAKAVGFVQKNAQMYVCAIEVDSPYRTFFEQGSGFTPHAAINRALEKLEDRLYRWRFGGGLSGSAFESPFQFNHTQPQG